MKSSTAKHGLKRCLNLALALSLATPASFAHGQSTVSPIMSDDPMALLVQAAITTSPEQAKLLMAKAKQRLLTEKLPENSQRKIENYLSVAEKEILRLGNTQVKSELISAPAPAGLPTFRSEAQKAIQPTPQVNAPTKPNDKVAAEIAQLQKILSENPALQDSMREINRGRVERDATQLQTTMPTQIAERNMKDMNFAIALDSPSEIISGLRSKGLLIKNAAELNRAAREEYDGVSTDELADAIISEYTLSSGIGGAGRGFIKILRESGVVGASDGVAAKAGDFMGIGAEALWTFTNNVNMITRLTELYGLKMSEANEDATSLMLFGFTKLVMQYGIKNPNVQDVIVKSGAGLGNALASRDPKQMKQFFSKMLKSPALMKALRKTPVAAGALSGVAAAVTPTAAPGTPGVLGATPGMGAPVTPVTPVAAQPVDPAKQAEIDAAKKHSEKTDKMRRSRSLFTKALLFSASVGWSVAETRVVGIAAKKMLKAAKARQRALLNKSLNNFLMSAEGEGFIKLLILTMNIGNDIPVVRDPLASKDPKVQFILNVARSAKVCSPNERARFNTLVAEGKTAAGRAKALAGVSGNDMRLLRFACDTRLSQSRFNRMIKEFSTYNAIPESLITDLRLTSYNNRQMMGEVVMQLMYLDGDLDVEQELPFFRKIVAKILGLDMIEGLQYYTKLDGFIRSRGGMRKSATSPTGYAINDTSAFNPYDMSIGYTISGGPDNITRPTGVAK